jgi:hypothetical protein
VWKNLRLRYRFKLYCRPVNIVPVAREALQFVLLTYLCHALVSNKNQHPVRKRRVKVSALTLTAAIHLRYRVR